MNMASFATEDDGAADLFARPKFWRDSTLLDAPAPLARDFFDLVVKGWLVPRRDGYLLTPTQMGPLRMLLRSHRKTAISIRLRT